MENVGYEKNQFHENLSQSGIIQDQAFLKNLIQLADIRFSMSLVEYPLFENKAGN